MKFPADTLAIAKLYALLSAINASVAPIVISLGGLAGAYLLAEDKSLATLPVSGFNVGVAMMASPTSLLIFKIGRQRGFMAEALLGFLGITVAGMAIVKGSFFGSAWACDGRRCQWFRAAVSIRCVRLCARYNQSQAFFPGTHRRYRGWHHGPPAGHVQQRSFINPLWRIFGGADFLLLVFGDDPSTTSNS